MIDPADRQPSRSDGDGQLVGAEVVDVSATVVGVVDALLVDPGTRQGRWLRIYLPGVSARVVPIEAGSVDRLGRVVLPFDRQTLHSAPAVTGDVVTDADAAVLLTHLRVPVLTSPTGSAGPAGQGRGRLSGDDIVTAAIALVDAEGAGRLTMRRLGSALQVEAMALYRYFPSRRALLDALVERVVSDVATDPALQLVDGDSWEDYLHRLAHGVRQMALTHPRVFPLIATHPTEAPWIRPPIRSVRWVDAFLAGLQDHDFPPVAAVTAYKRFSTFLLGHLLLEVAPLGLDHDDTASAPPPPPDRDHRIAEQQRRDRAEAADAVMTGDAPDADDIVAAATSRTRTVADEPAVQAADPGALADTGAAGAGVDAGADVHTRNVDAADVDAVAVDAEVPVVAALVSTATIDLDGFPHVTALAGLLAHDTSAADFDDDLSQVIAGLARLRRP